MKRPPDPVTAPVIRDPRRHFRSPSRLVQSPLLDPEEKLDLLRNWEHDERLKLIAEDEGMTGGPPRPSPLPRIRAARRIARRQVRAARGDGRTRRERTVAGLAVLLQVAVVLALGVLIWGAASGSVAAMVAAGVVVALGALLSLALRRRAGDPYSSSTLGP